MLKNILKLIISLFFILNYVIINAAWWDIWLSPSTQEKDEWENFSVNLNINIWSKDLDASVFEFDYDNSKVELDTSKWNNWVDLWIDASSWSIVVNTNPSWTNKLRVVLSHPTLLTWNNKKILKIYFKPKSSFAEWDTTTIFLRENKSQVAVETSDGQWDFHNLTLNNTWNATIKILIPSTCDSSSVVRNINEINKFNITCSWSPSTKKTKAIISYSWSEQDSFIELWRALSKDFYIPAIVTNYSANCYVANKLNPTESDWKTSNSCTNNMTIVEVFNLTVEKFVDNISQPANTASDAVKKNNDTNFTYKIRIKNEWPWKVTWETKIIDNWAVLEWAWSWKIEILSWSWSNWNCTVISWKLECKTNKEVNSGQYFDIITVSAKTSVDAKWMFKNTSEVINFNEPNPYRTDNNDVAYIKSVPKDFNISLKKYVDIEDSAHDAQDPSSSIYKNKNTSFEYIIRVKNNWPFDTFWTTKVIDNWVTWINILSATSSDFTCNINAWKLVCTSNKIISNWDSYAKILVTAETSNNVWEFTNIAIASNIDEKSWETSDNSDSASVKVLWPGWNCTNLSTAHDTWNTANIIIHCSANYPNRLKVNIYKYDVLTSSYLLEDTLQSLLPSEAYNTSYVIDLSKKYHFECLTENELVVKNECFDEIWLYACWNDILEPWNNEECDLWINNWKTWVLCDTNCKIITPPGWDSWEITITALDWLKIWQWNNVFLNTVRDKISFKNTSNEILNFWNSKLCIDNIIPNASEYSWYIWQKAYVNISSPICSNNKIWLLSPWDKKDLNYSKVSNIKWKNITDWSINKIWYLNIYASGYKDTVLLSKLKYVEVIWPCSSWAWNILDNWNSCNLSGDLSAKAWNESTGFTEGNYAGTVVWSNVSSVWAWNTNNDTAVKNKLNSSNESINRNIWWINFSWNYETITSWSELISSLKKSDDNPNVLVSPEKLKIDSDITLEPWVKTIIVKNWDLEINWNIKYNSSDKDSSYAFIVKNWNIIIKDTVEEIQWRFLLLDSSKKIKWTTNSNIPLVISWSIYWNSSELKLSRTYNRGDTTYQALSTWLVIKPDNRTLPPKYKEHYKKYKQLKISN